MMHVTIRTACLEESIKFYEENVGLSIHGDLRTLGGSNIVFLADSENDTKVELIESPDESYSGSGISLGFHCEDVVKSHEEALSKGLNPTPLISPNPHTTFFFITDPNGVSIQFI